MTGPGNDDNRSAERLRALMSQAERPATPPMPEDIEDGDGPSDMPLDASLADVEWCATLDHSDTDNGKRLLRHRGQDLARMMEVGSEKATWAVWSERYWDAQDGAFQALAKAQAIGGLIGLEAEFLRHTPQENAAIRKALDNPTEENVKAKDAANAALEKRQAKRRAFGVTSKNSARLAAMLSCAAPHCAVKPEEWNADQRLTYVANGTLRFIREVDDTPPDPDAWQSEEPRYRGRHVFTPDGWRREDRVTRMMPVVYEPKAKAEKWRAFIAEMLPEALVPGVA